MKICIIGAGKRMNEMYGPVLESLKSIVEVSGIWNRTPEKTKNLSEKYGWKSYEDRDKMIQETQPDAILVVVNSSSIKNVVLDCLKYKISIIMETPVWDKEIINKSREKNIDVYVNEQTPYLPCEEFKMMLLNSKEFGVPIIAMNDCRTFEYHGISQLRRYIGYEKNPVDVVGSITPHIPINFKDNNGKIQNHTEGWEFGTIKFDSGQVAVYNFSSIYNRCPFRQPRSMRIYCTAGTISNDDNEFIVHRLSSSGDTEKIQVSVEGKYMSSKKFEAIVNGKIIIWKREEVENDLNDQQIAIRSVFSNNLKAIKNKDSHLGYTVMCAYQDVNLLNAIRYSGQNRKFLP